MGKPGRTQPETIQVRDVELINKIAADPERADSSFSAWVAQFARRHYGLPPFPAQREKPVIPDARHR